MLLRQMFLLKSRPIISLNDPYFAKFNQVLVRKIALICAIYVIKKCPNKKSPKRRKSAQSGRPVRHHFLRYILDRWTFEIRPINLKRRDLQVTFYQNLLVFHTVFQGCQTVYFLTKNPNLGKCFEGLRLENVNIF
jgi:hypothetical protein